MTLTHDSSAPRASDGTRSGPRRGTGIAPDFVAALAGLLRGEPPFRVRAWDGSEAGPAGAPVLVIHSPRALRRLLWHPNELGAAQAYVLGEIDVDGDLDAALDHVRRELAARDLGLPVPTAAWRALRAVSSVGGLGAAPAPPESQARLRGRRHSQARDRAAISHHYDLSNEFYGVILDTEHRAYSSAYWPDGATGTLEQAQARKLDLVCTKLGLEPGSHLLDVGCGWGSLTLHAAGRFGARVTGVTISAEQHAHVTQQVAERGLEDLVEVRLQDYREVESDGRHDAAASIEMGEHVGEGNYPTFVATLRDAVRPGGRVLVQQISRRGRHPGGGPFIEAFIAPDMHMRPVGETVGLLEQGGLEVRDVHALREHYVHTVDHWLERFEARADELRRIVPEEVIRVWRLYLVGGRAAFRDGRMGVDQILAVRPGDHDLPLTRDW